MVANGSRPGFGKGRDETEKWNPISRRICNFYSHLFPSRDEFWFCFPVPRVPRRLGFGSCPHLHVKKSRKNQVFHSVIFCPRYFSLMQNIHVYFAVNYRIIWYGSDQSSKKRRDTVSRKLSGTRYTVEFLERESFWDTMRDALILLESSLKTYFCK